MAALTDALLKAPATAGDGLEIICKRSAEKAVNEVLSEIFRGSVTTGGIIRLRYTEFSDSAIERIVRNAIDRCCD